MTLRRLTVALVALFFGLGAAPGGRATAASSGSLVDAIRRNDLPAVRQASRSEATRELDETGTTPLMYAALCATPDILRALIDGGHG